MSSQNKTVRGFALYVGLSEAVSESSVAKVHSLIDQLNSLLTSVDPGAQSHVTITVAPRELKRRNLDLVRSAVKEATSSTQHTSGIYVDFSRRLLTIDGDRVELTFREYELLKFLILREGVTVSRDAIRDFLVADKSDTLPVENSRFVDVTIRRLRAKLGKYDQIISTVRGKGYRFDRHADVEIFHGLKHSPDRV